MLFNRRVALGGLIAGGLLKMIGPTSGQAGVADFERYRSPIEITADDIAWFRECRSVWIDGESGAPAVVPALMSLREYPDVFTAARLKDLRDRLERTFCAFCLHARFEGGHYVLAPPVPASEGFAGAPELAEFDVSRDHVRLLQETDWRMAAINTKRPYGRAVYCEVDVARILGIPIPELSDGESLPAELDARLTALHHDLLFVLQTFLQHAELAPGRYRIPFDGWDLIRPRCQPVTQARLDAYVEAWERLRRRTFANNSDAVIPMIDASELLLKLD